MAGRVEQVWTEVLDRASEQIDVSSLRVWFEGIRPVDLQDDRLEISVPNTFAKEYIESRFRPLLEEVLNSVTGEQTSLVVSVAGPGAHATNGAAADLHPHRERIVRIVVVLDQARVHLAVLALCLSAAAR